MNRFDDLVTPEHAPDDPLLALGLLDPGEQVVRPLAGIAERAAQVRRARFVRTTVLGAAASVALVSSLALVLPGGGATSTPATATSATATPTSAPADCSHGTTVFDVGVHPELVHLLAGAGAPDLTSAYGVDLPGPPCSGSGTGGTAAVRARFSADGGTVTAGIVVSGPLAENPWPVSDWVYSTPGWTPSAQPTESGSPEPGGVVNETVTVHGTVGLLRRWPADSRTLLTVGTAGVQWQEPSTGTWWAVQSAGLSRAQLLAVAEGLGTTGDRLDEATVPTDGWTTLPVEDIGRPGHRFDANYGGDSDPLTLSVSDVPQFGPDLVGLVTPRSVKVADVNGARAFLRPIGIDGDSPSLQWAKDGLWFTLYAGPDTTFDQLVALARSVEHVPADDPRITRAVTTAPPNPYSQAPSPGGATNEPAPTATSSAASTATGPVVPQPPTTTPDVTPTDTGTVTVTPTGP